MPDIFDIVRVVGTDAQPPAPPQSVVRTTPCQLEWQPNTESDLRGYHLYWGSISGTYTRSRDIPKVQTTIRCEDIPLLEPGTWFAALTASDFSGNESDFSNEVTWTQVDLRRPMAVLNFKLTGTLVGEPDVLVKDIVVASGNEYVLVAEAPVTSLTKLHISLSPMCFLTSLPPQNLMGFRNRPQNPIPPQNLIKRKSVRFLPSWPSASSSCLAARLVPPIADSDGARLWLGGRSACSHSTGQRSE